MSLAISLALKIERSILCIYKYTCSILFRIDMSSGSKRTDADEPNSHCDGQNPFDDPFGFEPVRQGPSALDIHINPDDWMVGGAPNRYVAGVSPDYVRYAITRGIPSSTGMYKCFNCSAIMSHFHYLVPCTSRKHGCCSRCFPEVIVSMNHSVACPKCREPVRLNNGLGIVYIP